MKTLIVSPESHPLHLRQVPDSALLTGDRPLFMRQDADSLELTLMPAAVVCRLGLGVEPRFAARYYDAMVLVALNCPGAPAEATDADLVADNSLVVGRRLPVPEGPVRVSCPDGTELRWDGLRGAFDRAICAVAERSTLKTGDIIALDHPCATQRVPAGKKLIWTADGETALCVKII
ncbi:MAG: hypothetical protein K2M12_00665 [Muribaculaceae bacterium]|nr:hypothetical protein [Muribaculaceae bacterium]